MHRYVVSIIIPVFNDAKRLELCLRALHAQTYPQDLLELIVIDNGSTDDIAESVARAWTPNVRLEYETEPGAYQYAARNKGIGLARGEILAFTDSDCIPARDWIEAGVRALDAQQNRIVAGRIQMFARHPENPGAIELYDIVTGLNQQEYVEKWRFGAAANLFFFRKAVEMVGPFDQASRAGGDREWGQRACSLGLELFYADNVVVNHPARRRLKHLVAKVARTIGGAEDMSQRRAETYSSEQRRTIPGDFLPPIHYCRHLWSDPRLKSLGARLTIVVVAFLVRYIEAIERLRLKSGGELRRR